jgi:hypothetical protein
MIYLRTCKKDALFLYFVLQFSSEVIYHMTDIKAGHRAKHVLLSPPGVLPPGGFPCLHVACQPLVAMQLRKKGWLSSM